MFSENLWVTPAPLAGVSPVIEGVLACANDPHSTASMKAAATRQKNPEGRREEVLEEDCIL